jgi:regulator of PEP synthase PpsR (kinase-PPPase family)
LYTSNKAHFDRVDAVEYTLAHDDGCRPQDLAEADVVLVGVSRTAKSTTCFYLAYSGIRAANVPLFADCEPPPELLALDPRRVIGLTMNPSRLQSVREARLRGWKMDLSDVYARSEHIARELRAANEQMARHGWRCVDTSYKGIEEIAREVMQLLSEPETPTTEHERPVAE